MILLSAERIVPLCYSKKKKKGIKRKKRIEKMSPQYIYLQNLSFSFLGGYWRFKGQLVKGVYHSSLFFIRTSTLSTTFQHLNSSLYLKSLSWFCIKSYVNRALFHRVLLDLIYPTLESSFCCILVAFLIVAFNLDILCFE